MLKFSHYETIYFFEICTPNIHEMFIYKHAETIEYVKNSLLFKKNTNFPGKYEPEPEHTVKFSNLHLCTINCTHISV